MVMLSSYRESNIELKEYMEMFFSERKSKETTDTYYYAINNMSKAIFNRDIQYVTVEQLQSLTWQVINKYKTELMKELSNCSVNNRMSAIKSIIKYLTAREAISYDISKLDLVTTLPDDSENIEMIQLETLMDYVEFFETNEKRKGKEKKWVCLLALETGNRIQDLLNLKKNQFTRDGDDYILKSKGTVRGKGNKEYIERIGEELYNELMSLNPDSDKVFSIKYGVVLDAFNRANEYFGNTTIKYTPHSIKHLVAKIEYDECRDVMAVMKKCKHESYDTTMRYLKIEYVPRVGAFTRLSKVEKDAYKESNLNDLISVIDDLPMDVKYLINKKLEELK